MRMTLVLLIQFDCWIYSMKMTLGEMYTVSRLLYLQQRELTLDYQVKTISKSNWMWIRIRRRCSYILPCLLDGCQTALARGLAPWGLEPLVEASRPTRSLAPDSTVPIGPLRKDGRLPRWLTSSLQKPAVQFADL